MNSSDVSDRSRSVALVLGCVTGVFGCHRFYVGKVGTGIAMLLSMGGMGIWWLYDCILLVAGEFRDSDDKRLVRWGGAEVPAGRRALEGGNELLLEAMDEVRSEVSELNERVDFMERVLTRVRDRQALPGG